MLALKLTRSSVQSIRTAPINSIRSYSVSPSSDPSLEPQRRPSYSPLWLGLTAVGVIAGYYSISNSSPPKTSSTQAIERALSPKTQGANVDGEDPASGYVKRH